MWSRLRQYAGQALAYLVFIAFVGYLSTSPAYMRISEGQALVKLTFDHFGQRKGECRERTDEELAALPPNMRQRMVCPRGRSPVTVRLGMDGKLVYEETARPTRSPPLQPVPTNIPSALRTDRSR